MSKRTLLVIKIGQDGVQEVAARPHSVSEQTEVARLTELIALPLRLLDDSIREASNVSFVPENVPSCAKVER